MIDNRIKLTSIFVNKDIPTLEFLIIWVIVTNPPKIGLILVLSHFPPITLGQSKLISPLGKIKNSKTNITIFLQSGLRNCFQFIFRI